MSSEMQGTALEKSFDGPTGGVAWLRWTRLSTIGNWQDVEPMVNWTEAQGVMSDPETRISPGITKHSERITKDY